MTIQSVAVRAIWVLTPHALGGPEFSLTRSSEVNLLPQNSAEGAKACRTMVSALPRQGDSAEACPFFAARLFQQSFSEGRSRALRRRFVRRGHRPATGDNALPGWSV